MAFPKHTVLPRQSNVDRLLNAIGDFNPQLLRELKGQLKPRNVGLAIGLSIVNQGLLCFIFSRFAFAGTRSISSSDWEQWGSLLSVFLGMEMIAFLILGGVHQLIENYAKERQTGTLDFLRLTPQSGDRILLGKLLGVPALLYLAVLAAVPLHAFAAIASGHSLWTLSTIYSWRGG